MFLLFLYLVISSAPITNADALDYHVGVPIFILNNGYFPTDWTWFHARQAGAGELLISLGLSIGAEQFGNLAQYSGLISIVGLLFYLGKKKRKKNIIVNLIIIGFSILTNFNIFKFNTQTTIVKYCWNYNKFLYYFFLHK